MIYDIIIALVVVGLASLFWNQIAKLQKNIDLLNNYAFSSFERIITLEAVLNSLVPSNTEENDDDHQA